MHTANDSLRDALISHQIGLTRLSNREVRRILRLLAPILANANRELRRRLYIASLTPGGDRGPLVTRQIEQAVAAIAQILAEGYAAIGGSLQSNLLDLAAYEAGYVGAAVRSAIPLALDLDLAYPSLGLLRQLVLESPMQGGLVGQWFRKTGKRSLVRSTMKAYKAEINTRIAEGLLVGQPIDKTVRQIALRVGTIARRHLRAVVDTATKHAAQSARESFLGANSEVVKGYQWLSTLDLKTTKAICVPRDGKAYTLKKQPIGHGYSWGAGPGRIHWVCRSGMTAILKSWEELGIDAKELGPGERASMDGRASTAVKLPEWLRDRQWSGTDLREMFGVRRAIKIEAGELTIPQALRGVGVAV